MTKTMLPVALAAVLLALAPCAATYAQESSPAARAALAHQLYDSSLAALGAGAGRPSDAYDWSVRWMRADLEAHVANAAQAHYDRMTALLARVRGQVAAGLAPASSDPECQYYVAEARAWIAHPPSVP